jgi:hypothetical protein
MPRPSGEDRARSGAAAGAVGPLEEFAARVRASASEPRLDCVVEVLDALEAAGVEPLLLKGPALVRELYRKGEHRSYGDLDLLVAPDDLVRAREVLVEIGFENTGDKMGIDDVAGIVHAEIWFRAEERSGATLLDLHRAIAGWHAPPEVVWKALTERRRRVSVGPRAVWVPAREGLALHVATHAAQDGTRNLKVTADLARAIERWEEGVWASARDLARRVQATDALSAGLSLLPAGAELARGLGLPRADHLSWAIEHRHARPRGTFHLQALERAETAREKIDVLRRSLFPNSTWMASNYAWVCSSRLRLAASYGLHLLRAPAWAARAWRYRRRERRAGAT